MWFTIGIGGIVCGAIAMSLARKNKFEYSTTGGFVTGIIGLIIGVIMLIAVIAAFAIAGAALGGFAGLAALGGY